MSVIPVVGGTSIYVSSRRKKFSILSNVLVSASWQSETALMASADATQSKKVLTVRRTAIPVKITPLGGYTTTYGFG
jgi:hypothetical protein